MSVISRNVPQNMKSERGVSPLFTAFVFFLSNLLHGQVGYSMAALCSGCLPENHNHLCPLQNKVSTYLCL